MDQEGVRLVWFLQDEAGCHSISKTRPHSSSVESSMILSQLISKA